MSGGHPTNGSLHPSGSYTVVPVGSQCTDGTWHKLRRDLDADLRSVFGVGVEHVLDGIKRVAPNTGATHL
jgi:hypothetical protein